jgi:hypothetical protein
MAVNGHDPLGRLYGPGGIGNPGPGLGYGLGVGARDVRLSNGPESSVNGPASAAGPRHHKEWAAQSA